MANELTRTGYGQVELNHMSAQRTGQIYAQLPWSDTTAGHVLENGQFLKYDPQAGTANPDTSFGEWMLVYNEEKLYEVGQLRKDFAMKVNDAVDGVVVPRLFKTNIGDIFTTNTVKQDAAGVKVAGANLVVGTDGILTIEPTTPVAGVITFNVVKVTTMPDGQVAVKLQRIQ